jgi:dolichyl-phosphate-mannose--protein O-mannosyl transferase
MGSIYLGYIALAMVLTDCFENRAESWEHLALLLTMTPAFVLGLGTLWGSIAFGAVLVVYEGFTLKSSHSGRFVATAFMVGAIVLFVYYFPVWIGSPINRDGYYDRMWLQGTDIRNWI